MDTIQCAIVLAKLETFEWEVERREQIGARYLQLLVGANGIGLPVIRPDRTSVWAQFTIQVEDRENVVAVLNAAGVPTAVHYPIPLHLQPAYGPLVRIAGTLKNAEQVAARVLSLPMHPYLEPAEQDRIVRALRSALA